jgi:predicted DNA-binding transcriptional regulator YafY
MEVRKLATGDKIIRLVRMILLINAHPGLSVEELAKRNGISVRQCFRDLQALCCAGVPIFCDNGYRMLEKTQLQKVSLTLEEALALIYGLKLLEKQKGFLHAGTEVREKLLELLPLPLQHEIEDIQKQIDVSVGMTVDYTGKDNLFKKMNTAIRTQQCMSMDYYSFNRDQYSTRIVDPYQIVFRDGFWYLVAFCHLRDEIRLFRVDRIQQLELTADSFLKPTGFDLEAYLGSAWQMERGQEFGFTVRFSGDAARYVQETQFHPSQQVQALGERQQAIGDNDEVIFTAKACGLKSVARWILAFGSEAEVLEPIELRELVIKQIQVALQKY